MQTSLASVHDEAEMTLKKELELPFIWVSEFGAIFRGTRSLREAQHVEQNYWMADHSVTYFDDFEVVPD